MNHFKWTLIGYAGVAAVGIALLHVDINAWAVVLMVTWVANMIGYIEGLKSR